MTANSKTKKKKNALLETYTKMLVTLVVGLWAISYIAAFVIWVIVDRYNRELLDVINTVAVPVMLSYCVKSGYEFKVRYNNATTSTNNESTEDESVG